MRFKKQLERINKAKPILIEAFVEYYGEEYRDKIKERINNVKFFFETPPTVAKSNLDRCPSRFNLIERMIIKEEYEKYKKLKNDITIALENKIVDEVYEKVKETIQNKDMIKENLYLLSKDFSASCVDAFSSDSLNTLNDERKSKSMKESIRRDQEKFLSIFGISKEFVSVEKVDRFIEFREKIRNLYLNDLAVKSLYGIRQRKIIEDETECEVDDSYIINDFYNYHLSAFSWSTEELGVKKSGCIIKVPLFDVRLDSKAFADECFIHEIVHCVETVDSVGIMEGEKVNRMANEIRTQMVAKKIAKKLRENGAVIFDDSLRIRIRRERCLYENMFPLVYGIFDKYEEFMSKCAIKGVPWLLEDRFGKEWRKFSKKLDEIYEEFGRWDTVYCDDIEDGELIKELKEKMDNNFKKREKDLKSR